MPIILWPITPISIYRDNKFENSDDYLQAQRFHSIVQILNQFSTITSNISDIFSELYDDISKISTTTEEISNRLQTLSDQVRYKDISTNVFKGMKMGWKLKITVGAPTVHRSTIPEPIEKMYQSCINMPSFETLEKFNPSGTPCSHKYSNPGFFMQQWINDLNEEAVTQKNKRMERREQRKQALKPTLQAEGQPRNVLKTSVAKQNTRPLRESLKAFSKPSTPEKVQNNSRLAEYNHQEIEPLPHMEEEIAPIVEPPKISQAPPIPSVPISSSGSLAPPPPPPAPPKIEILEVTESVSEIHNVPPVSKPPPVVSPPPASGFSSKGGIDLLSSIRAGTNLKKIDLVEEKKVDSYQGNDVASILARRVALAGSDGDDSSHGHRSDSNDWDDY